MTDFEKHKSKERLVKGIYIGSSRSYSYIPEVRISSELSDSSSITSQSNGKDGVKVKKMI